MLHLYRENQYDHKLTFSHWYVSWYWQTSLDAPSSIPWFTRGLTNCDYLKSSLLRVFPFNQTKTPLTEQAVARFILMQTVKRLQMCSYQKWRTSVEKSSSTGPSASSKHSFPSLLYANIPSNKNLSPKCPNRFLVDFNYQPKLSRMFRVTVSAKKLTVTSFSRSREGSVDGAKCSFLRTHCLMILSLSRMEPTLDSGVPDEVRTVFGLEGD